MARPICTSLTMIKANSRVFKYLTRKASSTTNSEFANTVDPDETAQNEPSDLHLQCVPSNL